MSGFVVFEAVVDLIPVNTYIKGSSQYAVLPVRCVLCASESDVLYDEDSVSDMMF